MKQRMLLGLFVLLSLSASSMPLAAQETTNWHKAEPPIQTRWYDEVSPDNALPEYPRPQMVRDAWLNLNGLWQFAPAVNSVNPPFDQTLDEQILVPYPVESALSGLMRHEAKMWYRREFNLSPNWAEQRVLLHFGAVDWQTTVYVNGQEAGRHTGGYDGFSFDITDALNAQNPQEVVVYVEDPTDHGGQPRGKQVSQPGGIWYTSTSGIWQTVWIEPVAAAHIDHLSMTPDIDAGVLRLTVSTVGAEGDSVRATAFADAEQVAAVEGVVDGELAIAIHHAHLWSPDDPFLYDLRVELMHEGEALDSVGSYFGMRKISVGLVNFAPRILLNNQFVFQIGPLDQGFYPEGIYTAPTDEALRSDLEFAKQIGWNMVRKHIKVEPERWYYWADRLGVLVWQDMPSTDANNQISAPEGDFERELTALIEGRRNHPSIVLWVVFNEGWGQDQFGSGGTARLVSRVHELDPSRLITDASGWTDYNVGNVHDIHTYVGPDAPLPEAHRASVQGEFGGLGLHTPGHEWSAQSFAYEWQDNSAILTGRYVVMTQKLQALMHDFGLGAAVYTEISDVEQELNGFLTYDRAIIKVDVDKVSAANRDLIEQSLRIGGEAS